MSLSDALQRLAEAQRAVVEALASEYFCDDLEPPVGAFGWSENQLRHYFESGGEEMPAEVPLHTSERAQPDFASDEAAERRPVIVCLGDSLTDFANHVVGPKFADSTLKNLPTASEALRASDGGVEQGPGWITLLVRDYQWRSTADVVNRGYSGMTSRILKADLAAIVTALPVAHPKDVAAVVLMIGANDASDSQVPVEEFKENLTAICESLNAMLPAASIIMATPPPINNQVWPASTNKKGYGGGRSLERLKPYAEAVRQVVSAVGTPCRLLDLQNDFITRLMHWADTMHDGFHLSTKGNVFIYKQVGEALRNVALNPSQLPMKRPPTLRATVTCWHDDMDGRYAKASRLT